MEHTTKMSYRQLGNSSLHISRIGFGCMSLKPGHGNPQPLIDEAINAGINYFDTADIYNEGENEVLIGKALKAKRKELIIATKAGNELTAGGRLKWNPGKAYIIQAAEKSLQRLQTDYIDLYQLHGGTIEDDIDDTISAFETLQQQGKIRYYGISSIRPNVIREYVKRSNIVSVMMQYSVLDRRPEESCLTLLHEHHIGVLARGSVAGGLLAGKAATSYLKYTVEEVGSAATAINAATPAAGNAAATAIEFVLQHPAITAAIVGIGNSNQLTAALQTMNNSPRNDNNRAMLNKAVAINTYDQHR